MPEEASSQTLPRTAPRHRRWWPISIAAVVLFAGLAAAVVLVGSPRETSATTCSDATSSQCRPFLDALYLVLGERGSEVASVRGRPWCGEDACQALFGAEALRLRVTYYDDSVAEYLCTAGALADPVCQPAASDR